MTFFAGREFEKIIRTSCKRHEDSDDELELPNTDGWRAYTPLVWMCDPVYETGERKETRVGQLIRTYRNELGVLVTVGILAFHLLENIIQPPQRYPDVFIVLNILISLGFFTLIVIFVHCMMFEEVQRYED